MGYYSDVAIGIVPKYKEVFDALLKTVDIEPDSVKEDSSGYIYSMYSRKWYDGYDDVDAVMTFLSELDEEDYKLVRSGEDLEDNEYDGAGDFGIYICKQMNIDCGGEPEKEVEQESTEFSEMFVNPEKVEEKDLRYFLNPAILKEVNYELYLKRLAAMYSWDIKSHDLYEDRPMPENKDWRFLATLKGLAGFEVIQYAEDDKEKALLLQNLTE